MDPKHNDPPKKPGGDDKKPKNIWMTLLISVAILLAVVSIFNFINNSKYTETTYSDFVDYMNAKNLDEVEIHTDRIIYMTKEEADKPAGSQKAYYTGIPAGCDTLPLGQALEAMGVTVNYPITEDNTFIITILYYVLMFGGIFLFTRMLSKRMSGEGMMGGFGKSKAKVYMEKQTGVTFKDVAGQDEAKESLQEIIDFLHNPQKYT